VQNNQAFLAQVSRQFKALSQSELNKQVLLLPTKRSVLYLKKYWAQQLDKPIILPPIYTIEEFFQKVSNLKKADKIVLAIELYKTHVEIEKNKAKSLDDFLALADVIIDDFSEMDIQMAETRDFLTYISEERAISTWNPDGREPSQSQKEYIAFWKNLEKLYHAFVARIIPKGIAYQGLIHKRVLQQLQLNLSECINLDSTLHVIGFNALNNAEIKIFSLLKEQLDLQFYWDADAYYTDSTWHEAGLFIRKHLAEFKQDKSKLNIPISNCFTTQKKEINCWASVGYNLQVETAASILAQIPDDELNNTLVVPADTQLLASLLESLPDNITKANITMGLTLSSTPFFSLCLDFIKLWESYTFYLQERNRPLFLTRNLLDILENPYLLLVQNSVAESFNSHCLEKNLQYISPTEAIDYLKKENSLLVPFLQNESGEMELVQTLEKLCTLLCEHINNQANLTFLLEKEVLNRGIELLRNWNQILQEIPKVSVLSLKRMFEQIVAAENINFSGEPLQGLQIMGMLETRTLDFKRVIILSCNEGYMPSKQSNNSFIPYELRRHLHMFGNTEKDSIFAYHFYRLLQRAEHIHLLYNADSTGNNKGEKSRYILQLKDELCTENIRFNEHLVIPSIVQNEAEKLQIEKTDEILKLLLTKLQRRISASHINKYIQSPLAFYYSYLLGLSEEKNIDNEINTIEFGNVIHNVLETVYKEYVGKFVEIEGLQKAVVQIPAMVKQDLLKKFGENEISMGRNALQVSMCEYFIERFIKDEIRLLTEGNQLKIISLEQSYQCPLNVNGVTVNLFGKIDRVDEYNGKLRLIDFKTGKTDVKQLNINDMQEVFVDYDKNKAQQLLFYTLLYAEHENISPDLLSVGIISTRKADASPMFLAPDCTTEMLETYKRHLVDLIAEMLNPAIPFAGNELLKEAYLHYLE
jgi:ATP-dependent helicase/nuclease subunit B